MEPQQIIWRMDVKFSGRGGGIIIPYDFHDFLASCHGELDITSGLTSGGDPIGWISPLGKTTDHPWLILAPSTPPIHSPGWMVPGAVLLLMYSTIQFWGKC